jgi:hypothetical protein
MELLTYDIGTVLLIKYFIIQHTANKRNKENIVCKTIKLFYQRLKLFPYSELVSSNRFASAANIKRMQNHNELYDITLEYINFVTMTD